jgi:hypothetical protein
VHRPLPGAGSNCHTQRNRIDHAFSAYSLDNVFRQGDEMLIDEGLVRFDERDPRS